MTNTISDIIDQQIDKTDLATRLKELGSDHELTKTWRNYHLIGDVIRGDVMAAHGCVIERVDKALDAEPLVVAPVDFSIHDKDEKSSEVWKSAGLFAVAASLALVAVVSLKPNQTAVEPAGQVIATAATQQVNQLGNQPAQANVISTSFEDEFGQMLVEHGEFSASSGLNGLISYSKLVSNQTLDQ